MHTQRYLIVNADDLGLSPGVNAGIIQAHERGIVTSASLMVRWPAALAAAEYAREHPRLGLGLHLDLGEWIYRDGGWSPLYEVVPLDDFAAVQAEALHQLNRFRRLFGGEPAHIDSHQHVHLQEPVRSVVRAMGQSLAIPVRHCMPQIRYCGDFYGQSSTGELLPEAITPQRLMRLLESLSIGPTELACHPGWDDELATMYCSERAVEVDTLCDEQVRETIAALNIQLATFAELAAVASS